MKKIILIYLLCTFNLLLHAQTPYEDTTHWKLIIDDDFSSLRDTLWEKVHDMSWGLECYSNDKTVLSNNTLNLTCDINPNYDPEDTLSKPYVSGGIWSLNKRPYSYGYFEIETKMPPRSRGYWGGFWLHAGAVECDSPCNDFYDNQVWHELDIFEPYGCPSENPNNFPSSARKTEIECCSRILSKNNNLNTYLDLGFNKIAAIWMPKEAIIYVNGVETVDLRDDYKYNYVPSIPMYLYITFQVDKGGCRPNASSIFPATWQFRKFKYYQLKTKCDEDINEEYFDFINHDYYVQKSYHLTNSTVPNNSNVYIRAVNDIVLDGDFEVPLGSNFNAIVHYGICPGEIEN
ncbi:MAG: hypothetical protein H6Q16_1127 [Bacteroidetes bacterium]|nr:hypothetical protein [Bacteroidota bacterium]